MAFTALGRTAGPLIRPLRERVLSVHGAAGLGSKPPFTCMQRFDKHRASAQHSYRDRPPRLALHDTQPHLGTRL